MSRMWKGRGQKKWWRRYGWRGLAEEIAQKDRIGQQKWEACPISQHDDLDPPTSMSAYAGQCFVWIAPVLATVFLLGLQAYTMSAIYYWQSLFHHTTVAKEEEK